MDDPRSYLTNVHKVEGILFVQWTVYTVEANRPAHVSHEYRKDWDFETLQAAQHDLRQDGHHVYHDVAQDQLWIFMLPGPSATKDPKSSEKAGNVSTIVARHQLKKGPSGALKAADLAEHPSNATFESGLGKRKRSPSVLASPHESGSLQAFRHNFSIESPSTDIQKLPGMIQSSTMIPDNDSLYVRIITAISMSISYMLVRSNRCLALSPSMFLMCKSILGFGDTVSPDEAGSLLDDQNLPAFLLEVIWQPNGALIITSYPYSDNAWSQVHQASLQTPSQVYLSPFGWNAVAAKAKGSPERQNSESRLRTGPDSLASGWRRACATLLERQGIHLTQHTRWLNVIPDDDWNVLGSNHKGFEWPMHLCFQTRPHESIQEHEDDPLWDLERNGTHIDPLSDAEKWFLGKDKRKAAANEQQRQRQMEEKDGSGHTSEDDDDLLANLRPKNEEVTSLQTPSAIYPTPPDGNKPQVTAPVGKHGRSGTEGIAAPNYSNLNKEELTHDPGTDNEISLGAYNHLEDDDLFGEMEADMFADNGLTEDDFSFFDNPGSIKHSEHSVMNRTSENSQSVRSEPRGSSPQRNRVEVRPNDGEQSHKEEATSTKKLITSPRPTEDKQAKGAYSVRIPKTRRARSTTSDIAPRHDTPLKSLPLPHPDSSERSRNGLDHKYTKLGKFAPSTYGHPSTTGPRTMPSVQKTIPQITRPTPCGNSDLEEDSDASPIRDFSSIEGSEDDHEHTSKGDLAQLGPRYQDINKGTGDSIDQRGALNSPPDSELSFSTELPTMRSILQNLHGAPARENMHMTELFRHLPPDKVDPKEYISVAQIFTDQFVHYESLPDDLGSSETENHSSTIALNDSVSDLMPLLFPRSMRCTLDNYALVGEEHKTNVSVPRPASRPMIKKHEFGKASQDSEPKPAPSIFHIPIPSIRVRRGGVPMDISSTALLFWEELGLSPFLGSKDITAFCIYPNTPMLQQGAGLFLNSISQTYLSFRLGSHSSGHSTLENYPSGLVPTTVPKAPNNRYLEELSNLCVKLGRSLTPLATLGKTIAIYMINPHPGVRALYSLCTSFLKLFEAYASSVRHVRAPADMVLQVIPLSWIGSSSTISIQPPKSYIRLAKIVYDRCPVQGQDASPYASASLFRLADTIPKTLEFKLGADSPTSLFQHISAAHIGYSWKHGSRWLSSVVTDSHGCHHWTASYFLSLREDSWSIFRAAAKEIWETFLEVMDVSHGSHRLYISKSSPMLQAEIDAWMELSNDYSTVIPVFVVVDEAPPISLADNVQSQENFDIDQVTTPLPLTPEIPSPDVNGPRLTEENDPTARLIDTNEEGWGVISARSFVVNTHGLDICNDFANGYLVKGNKTLIGIRVVYTEKSCDLKDLLSIYHGLSILTKARGIASKLPWHLAFARKAYEGLEAFT